jgi:hypothetical protein
MRCRLALAVLTSLIVGGHAGPLAYALCQAGCASVVTACYAAGGATWGATMGGHRTRYYLGLQHGLWYMSRCLCHCSFAGSDALRIVDVEDHWR